MQQLKNLSRQGSALTPHPYYHTLSDFCFNLKRPHLQEIDTAVHHKAAHIKSDGSEFLKLKQEAYALGFPQAMGNFYRSDRALQQGP